jgi:DNA-binding NarL/FixJ family response regulator
MSEPHNPDRLLPPYRAMGTESRRTGRQTRVVVVDDDDINRRGMANLLAEDTAIDIVASLTHAEALDRPSPWDEIDVVLADAADERNRADHFPGVAVVEEVRRHDRGGQTVVVITGHFFDDAVRRRMREAKADFYYHRTVVCDARSLRDAVFRPDAQRWVPGPVDPETLFSQG